MTRNTAVITPRDVPIDPTHAAPFDARVAARDLFRASRVAALATLDRDSGYPYNTFTNLSVEPDGTPVFYAAGVSLHARNLLADPRVSLSMTQVGGLDVLNERRLTLVGRAHPLPPEICGPVRERYRRRFPKSAAYLGLNDARMFRMVVEGLHFNGGPARNTDDLTPADLRTDLSGAEDLCGNEAGEIRALNGNRQVLAALSARAGGARGQWRITSIDPAGIDLAAEGAVGRIWFPARVVDRAGLRGFIASIGGPTKL